MKLNTWYKYKNKNSGIEKYRRLSETRFSIKYKNGKIYDYTVEDKETVDELMSCAIAGKGLNSLINRRREEVYGRWIIKYNIYFKKR